MKKYLLWKKIHGEDIFHNQPLHGDQAPVQPDYTYLHLPTVSSSEATDDPFVQFGEVAVFGLRQSASKMSPTVFTLPLGCQYLCSLVGPSRDSRASVISRWLTRLPRVSFSRELHFSFFGAFA